MDELLLFIIEAGGTDHDALVRLATESQVIFRNFRAGEIDQYIEFIHQRLLQARSQGKAVLLVSADLEEILSIADRIAVMYEGQIVGTLDPVEATQERLGLMMTGGGK